MQLLQNLRRLHGDGYSGCIVDGAGAEIPRVEVTGDDNHFLRMLASLKICDHVVAGGVRK